MPLFSECNQVLRPGIDVLLLGIELQPMPEKWFVHMPPRSAHVTNVIAAQNTLNISTSSG